MLFDETQKFCSSSSYFDREIGARAVKILAGEYFATDDDLAITTLLGSCVSVCLFDRTAGVGGMNHFMLPQALRGTDTTRCGERGRPACGAPCSARYGACAMRHLLTHLERLGAKLTRLEAKLFGAGRVMGRMTDIGAQNAQFALGYLEEHRIPVMAQDLGDSCPRRIVFFPSSGRALVKRLRDIPAEIPL
jgi:chemotaxis protein CheD